MAASPSRRIWRGRRRQQQLVAIVGREVGQSQELHLFGRRRTGQNIDDGVGIGGLFQLRCRLLVTQHMGELAQNAQMLVGLGGDADGNIGDLPSFPRSCGNWATMTPVFFTRCRVSVVPWGMAMPLPR